MELVKPMVVVDLDSTIADTTHRREFVPTSDNGLTWTDYALHCGRDRVIEPVARLVRLLAPSCNIVFLSFRTDFVLPITRYWLNANKIPFDRLFLAPEEIARPPTSKEFVEEWKEEKMKSLISECHVQLAIEDWPGIAARYEALGVPTLLVGQNMGSHERGVSVNYILDRPANL